MEDYELLADEARISNILERQSIRRQHCLEDRGVEQAYFPISETEKSTFYLRR